MKMNICSTFFSEVLPYQLMLEAKQYLLPINYWDFDPRDKYVDPSNQMSIFSSWSKESANNASGLIKAYSLPRESGQLKWLWATILLMLTLKLKLVSSIFITTAVPLISSRNHEQVFRTVLFEIQKVIRAEGHLSKEYRLQHIDTSELKKHICLKMK